jgi:AhpD family alkylhydroperoxidase
MRKDVRMKKIEIFDPPMCCSTGICGPSVDEKLVRFAADLDWLKRQGFLIERYNLSQQPSEFITNAPVKATLEKDGNDCLPIIMIDGALAHKGSYPIREKLSLLAGISLSHSHLMTDAVRELVAIGAAIACNCEMCFKFHFDKARKLGVTDEDMMHAVDTGIMVKNASADAIKELAYRYLKKDEKSDSTNSGCSSGSKCS